MLEPRIIQRYYFQRCVVKDGAIYIEAIDNLLDCEVTISERDWPVVRNEMYDRVTGQCTEEQTF